jgi:uncharacterized lipoprotein YmbA
MHVKLHRIALFALGCSLLVLGGCADMLGLKGGSAPVHYYVLSSVSEGRADDATGPAKYDITVGVASVNVPEYLNNQMIVTRPTRNTVDLAELHNWAAPLSEHVTAVLAENLWFLIPADGVVRMPLSRAIPIDFEVRTRLEKFERDESGDVVLLARWVVFNEQTREASAIKSAQFRVPVVVEDRPSAQVENRPYAGGKDTERFENDVYEAIVAAMSKALGELSREIADTVRTAASTSR